MAKTVNYTPEMTKDIVDAYSAVRDEDEETRDAMVEELAAKYGKMVRSIRAKLSREGVYVSKKVVSKVTGEDPAKKEELAKRLVEVSGLNLVSAEKLNKTDLVALIRAFESAGSDEESDEAEPVTTA